MKGKSVSVYFTNETIMKRDIAVFSSIYQVFDPKSIRFEWKRLKGQTPFKKDDAVYDSSRRILVDELDSLFFRDPQCMLILSQIKASGVTATAHNQAGNDYELSVLQSLGFSII
jgi:hypothetical protein